MFTEFDHTEFPLVKVKMTGSPNIGEFESFLNQWTELYNQEEDFTFLFDTQDITSPPLKYCIKMAQFIKELRKKEYQYLQKSIILINDNKVKWMLDFIFLIQPPVAPVYIYHINNGIDNPIDLDKIQNHPETISIESGKPFLPLL